MKRDTQRRLAQTFSTLVFQGAVLFLSAGSLNWLWAWIFLALGIVVLIINLIVLPSEVIAERGRKKKNVKKWDKIITKIMIVPMMGLYAVSGLDHRFDWSGNLHPGIHMAALVLFFAGAMLFTWSMVSNTFFSTMVRIQSERDHEVATEGPYRHVRHPGYVGYVLMILVTPVALGSLYGITMSVVATVVLIVRTSLEDKTLRNELSGYIEYSNHVKYRLVPYVW